MAFQRAVLCERFSNSIAQNTIYFLQIFVDLIMKPAEESTSNNDSSKMVFETFDCLVCCHNVCFADSNSRRVENACQNEQL